MARHRHPPAAVTAATFAARHDGDVAGLSEDVVRLLVRLGLAEPHLRRMSYLGNAAQFGYNRLVEARRLTSEGFAAAGAPHRAGLVRLVFRREDHIPGRSATLMCREGRLRVVLAELEAARPAPVAGAARLLAPRLPEVEFEDHDDLPSALDALEDAVARARSRSGAEGFLLDRIAALNADPAIHGILVQMPLPKHIDPSKVIEAISTAKDVDGYSVLSAGELVANLPGFRPCTPYGCMKLIETTGIDLRGKHAVVIGRSNTVGKPMALLLLQANATVTICHSATPDLGYHTRQADVIVAAVGRRNTLTAEMVKPGAIVIDVGMNRDDAGKLCGDVDFAGVSEVASHITPVPGGVGPMTITMLLMNTLESAERVHTSGQPPAGQASGMEPKPGLA